MRNREKSIKRAYMNKVTRIVVGFDRTNKYSVLELEDNKVELEQMYRNFNLVSKHISELKDLEKIKEYIIELDKIMYRSKQVKVSDATISKNKFEETRKYALIYLDSIAKMNRHMDNVLA